MSGVKGIRNIVPNAFMRKPAKETDPLIKNAPAQQPEQPTAASEENKA